MFNTRSIGRLTLFHFIEHPFVTANRKSKQMTNKRVKTFITEQRPGYFLPFRCAYLSHIYFHFTSTRAPPAASDLSSHIHVGVALPEQMCPLTCTSRLKGNSRCWGRRHHTRV